MNRIETHPCETPYNLGYWDACAGEPLFDDAVPEYAEGWQAAWESKALFATLPHPPIGE